MAPRSRRAPARGRRPPRRPTRASTLAHAADGGLRARVLWPAPPTAAYARECFGPRRRRRPTRASALAFAADGGLRARPPPTAAYAREYFGPRRRRPTRPSTLAYADGGLRARVLWLADSTPCTPTNKALYGAETFSPKGIFLDQEPPWTVPSAHSFAYLALKCSLIL